MFLSLTFFLTCRPILLLFLFICTRVAASLGAGNIMSECSDDIDETLFISAVDGPLLIIF